MLLKGKELAKNSKESGDLIEHEKFRKDASNNGKKAAKSPKKGKDVMEFDKKCKL